MDENVIGKDLNCWKALTEGIPGKEIGKRSRLCLAGEACKPTLPKVETRFVKER